MEFWIFQIYKTNIYNDLRSHQKCRMCVASPAAAILGVPLYIRAETAIPIGVALMGKGMSIGAVIALVIGGAGMAIPEMSMLASIFKKKLVAMIVAVIFLTAVISGYLFNILL